jgi:antitoxin VapB
MTTTHKARVFRNGRSQAVRIPAGYRFAADEVYIERDPRTGALTLSEHPLRPSLDDLFAELDAAGAAGFTIDRDMNPPADRESL